MELHRLGIADAASAGGSSSVKEPRRVVPQRRLMAATLGQALGVLMPHSVCATLPAVGSIECDRT